MPVDKIFSEAGEKVGLVARLYVLEVVMRPEMPVSMHWTVDAARASLESYRRAYGAAVKSWSIVVVELPCQLVDFGLPVDEAKRYSPGGDILTAWAHWWPHTVACKAGKADDYRFGIRCDPKLASPVLYPHCETRGL